VFNHTIVLPSSVLAYVRLALSEYDSGEGVSFDVDSCLKTPFN